MIAGEISRPWTSNTRDSPRPCVRSPCTAWSLTPPSFETTLAERRAEFQLAQPLSHPNVLGVRELDQDGVYIYLTMNLMRGETLSALLERRSGKALARSAAFAIIRDIGAALSYAHDHGVVHGNLQPGAILISPAGELRIRGFGAQRALSCYASCEQLEGRPPDRRDDLYALACISYELLHGSHPFERQNASTARGRAMTPARPIQLTGTQWRALRQGLAWRREGRNLSVARWIGRMHVGSASKRLPMLVDLMAMPAPRRSFWRPLLLLGCLAAAAAFAASVYRSPDRIDFSGEWNRLRTAVTARVHPPETVSATAAPSLSAAPGMSPPPETAPAVQDAPTSAPEAQALATPGAPEAETPSPTASAAPAPQSAPTPPTVTPLPPSAPPAATVAAAPAPPVPSTDTLAPAPRSIPPTAAPAVPKAAPPKAPSPAVAAAPAVPDAKSPPGSAPMAPARLELSADSYAVQSGDSAAHIVVRRTGSTRGEARFVWWTENASATADQDFVSWGRRTERSLPVKAASPCWSRSSRTRRAARHESFTCALPMPATAPSSAPTPARRCNCTDRSSLRALAHPDWAREHQVEYCASPFGHPHHSQRITGAMR